jgi:hypothetical protein
LISRASHPRQGKLLFRRDLLEIPTSKPILRLKSSRRCSPLPFATASRRSSKSLILAETKAENFTPRRQAEL